MSCPNMVWALYRPDITPAERTILMHMANVCDAAQICRDSMAKMGRLFEMSVRTVNRCIKGLEARRYIEKQRRFRQANIYRVMIPDTEQGRRARAPAPVDIAQKLSTTPVDNIQKLSTIQPLNGDISCHTQPVDGDILALSPIRESARSGQNASFDSANLAQEESPKKESPKEAQAGAIAMGEEASKPAAPMRVEPDIERSLEGLSPPIAAIARRNGWGAGAESEREPAIAQVKARRAAHDAEVGALPKVLQSALSGLSRSIGGEIYAPGCKPARTVDQQVAILKPALKARPLTREQLSAAYRTIPVRPMTALGASP